MSRLRLRRIRFKSGGCIEVLKLREEGIAAVLKETASDAANFAPNMAGFALVAWKPNGEVFVNYRNGDRSLIPGGGVPQYVKDVLLAEVAVRWSKD